SGKRGCDSWQQFVSSCFLSSPCLLSKLIDQRLIARSWRDFLRFGGPAALDGLWPLSEVDGCPAWNGDLFKLAVLALNLLVNPLLSVVGAEQHVDALRAQWPCCVYGHHVVSGFARDVAHIGPLMRKDEIAADFAAKSRNGPFGVNSWRSEALGCVGFVRVLL